MGNGTSIGRVRGLGSAKEGARHFLQQRFTALANIALMLWLILSIARLPAYDYRTVATWLSSPIAAVPMVLLILSVFTHFRLGLQTVIEDYQHDENRLIALIALNFFTVGAGALAIFSILKIAFIGSAA